MDRPLGSRTTDYGPRPPDHGPRNPDTIVPTVLVLTRIVKRYGTRVAVDDLSLEVREGEILGLLGPNGSGKSTILRLITGYLAPTSGSTFVTGIDLMRVGRAAVKKAKLGALMSSFSTPRCGSIRDKLWRSGSRFVCDSAVLTWALEQADWAGSRSKRPA